MTLYNDDDVQRGAAAYAAAITYAGTGPADLAAYGPEIRAVLDAVLPAHDARLLDALCDAHAEQFGGDGDE